MDRAGRRRQIKADRKLIERGLDAASPNGREIVALMRVLHEEVRACIDAKSVDPLMSYLYDNMNGAIRRIANISIACRKGCAHCCNLWVSASAPETLYAFKAIARSAQNKTAQSILAADALTNGKSFSERADMVTPCPLLEDNLCGVYPARPVVCRTAASTSAAICERVYSQMSGEAVPTPVVYIALREGYALALSGALRKAGLFDTVSEYNAALKFVATNADAETRWLGGEDIFAELPRDQGHDFFQSPSNRKLYEAAFD